MAAISSRVWRTPLIRDVFDVNQPTLVYLFAEHARLTILHIFSILLALNRSCSLNYFEEFFYPACLLHPAHLIAKVKMRHFLETKEQNMLIWIWILTLNSILGLIFGFISVYFNVNGVMFLGPHIFYPAHLIFQCKIPACSLNPSCLLNFSWQNSILLS